MGNRICSIEGCDRKHEGLGYCTKHYQRFKRSGSPHLDTPDQRFERFIERGKSCWLWTGGTAGAGYGVFHWNGRLGYAHRFSYERSHGAIPPKMEVDHICRTKRCVNPDHLRLVTSSQNKQHKPRARSGRATSRFRGVSWSAKDKRWIAQVKLNGKRAYQQSFLTEAEAAEAARQKRLELFTHNDLDRVG